MIAGLLVNVFSLKQRHPAVLVTAGFFLIFLCQLLEQAPLYWFAGTGVFLAVLRARQHFTKVLRRLRFVALAIVVLFAWQTPGILIAPALGSLSPTYDGVKFAVLPLLRLVSVAAVVACLKEMLSPDQWVSSLYVVAKPLGLIGLPRERLAVRLRLVLDHVEESELDWRQLILGQSMRGEEQAICTLIPVPRLDVFLIGLICVAGLVVGAWQG